MANDICLLYLAEPISYDEYVTPACLPAANENMLETGRSCWVAGWGFTGYESEALPEALQQLNVNVVSHNFCSGEHSYGKYSYMPGKISTFMMIFTLEP